jgi:hypothetical protein
MSAHEPTRTPEPVKGSSDRGFGIVFAAVFVVLGGWPVLDGRGPTLWALAIAAAFALLAVVRPALLAPLNRIWTRFGLLLHRVVNPLVMAVLYFGVITPVALIMRATGRDPLNRRFDPGAASYWVNREPPGPASETMRNQF